MTVHHPLSAAFVAKVNRDANRAFADTKVRRKWGDSQSGSPITTSMLCAEIVWLNLELERQRIGDGEGPQARLVTEREAERERCAKIAEDWLTTFGSQKPQHVTAQTWACDAVRDIAQLIRSGQP